MQGIQKNQQYTIHIDGLTASGQGVGRIDGFAVFVPFALPEEEVTIRVVKAQKNYAFAKLESIVQASAERKNPLCPV